MYIKIHVDSKTTFKKLTWLIWLVVSVLSAFKWAKPVIQALNESNWLCVPKRGKIVLWKKCFSLEENNSETRIKRNTFVMYPLQTKERFSEKERQWSGLCETLQLGQNTETLCRMLWEKIWLERFKEHTGLLFYKFIIYHFALLWLLNLPIY